MILEFRHVVTLDPASIAAFVAAVHPLLTSLGASIVSQLSDAIKAATDSADAAIARVQGDLTTLHTEVADLQAKVDAGGASAEDIQALADLKGKLDALDVNNPATLPAETPPAVPTP